MVIPSPKRAGPTRGSSSMSSPARILRHLIIACSFPLSSLAAAPASPYRSGYQSTHELWSSSPAPQRIQQIQQEYSSGYAEMLLPNNREESEPQRQTSHDELLLNIPSHFEGHHQIDSNREKNQGSKKSPLLHHPRDDASAQLEEHGEDHSAVLVTRGVRASTAIGVAARSIAAVTTTAFMHSPTTTRHITTETTVTSTVVVTIQPMAPSDRRVGYKEHYACMCGGGPDHYHAHSARGAGDGGDEHGAGRQEEASPTIATKTNSYKQQWKPVANLTGPAASAGAAADEPRADRPDARERHGREARAQGRGGEEERKSEEIPIAGTSTDGFRGGNQQPAEAERQQGGGYCVFSVAGTQYGGSNNDGDEADTGSRKEAAETAGHHHHHHHHHVAAPGREPPKPSMGSSSSSGPVSSASAPSSSHTMGPFVAWITSTRVSSPTETIAPSSSSASRPPHGLGHDGPSPTPTTLSVLPRRAVTTAVDRTTTQSFTSTVRTTVTVPPI